MLDQRGIGMQSDIELSAGRFLYVLDERFVVDRVKDVIRVWRGHVPFGLRNRRRRDSDKYQCRALCS